MNSATGTQTGTVVSAGATRGATTAAAATAVGSSTALANTGLSDSFGLWAGALLLMGLFLAAAGRRKAAVNRR
ncbi:LPXTG cell wall anchor domain-containing protein [Paenarthrobacter nitroguajacolicus]|uniref:LPXTG cell wall anchor domain-containing protein n=2 Tax=Paenarthrobacter nitroguajacolicus TaxID=211146 RepID=A0A558GZN6_PAENT|nr:LPXTG cell wall anchor domain-containing protein [Paenarthrobacter nitroguajacolicus]